jgi:tRNA pseudouridine55 synthase
MNGVINFLKPPGMSSNGAVVYLRHLLGAKTGHAGTLDPGACGVLPICVGKATRISSYLMSGNKEYIAEVTFGVSTDTGDSYGRITAQSTAPLPKQQQICKALQGFIGCITQQTPAYSAVKQDGVKRYQRARLGLELKPKLREIEVFEAEYLGQTSELAHRIRIVCGKGTYIRTLCEDLGQSLGLPAYMSFLVRTRCADLGIETAFTADELTAERLNSAVLPIDCFLNMLPRIDADSGKRRLLCCGGTVAYSGAFCEAARLYADGELLGIGYARDGLMKISTLLVDE